MMHVTRPSILLFLALVAVSSLAGCGEKPPPPKEGPRPVTVVVLKEMDPVQSLQLTGAVSAWAEQSVSFEVEGRVARVVDEGSYLEGRWEQGDEVLVEGVELARVDDRAYAIARDIAQSAITVANENLRVAQVQLDRVLPANLEAARAERTRAEAEWDRSKQAFDRNAISEVDFIRATADRDTKRAKYEQAEAAIETQKAQIESLKASVTQAQEQLRQAEWDLSRCRLYAPFSGEVSAVYTEAGGYARQGEPVAHLVMLDPVLVDLSVSSETADTLRLADPVQLSVRGLDSPLMGVVYRKSTVADPDTRTFRVSILVRNRRLMSGRSLGDALPEYPRIERYMYLRRVREGDPDSPFCVEETRGLRKDADGYFVWAAPDIQLGERLDRENPVVTLRKYRVTPGEGRRNYQGIYLVRELDDIGELKPQSLVALDVPEGFEDGGKVLVAFPDWLLRPGQLVPAFLGAAAPKKGLYLPMDAIKPTGEGSGEVFVVSEGGARKTAVKILDSAGEIVRVEAADPEGAALVKEGAQVITDYIHFLVDGEPVQVIRKREIQP